MPKGHIKKQPSGPGPSCKRPKVDAWCKFFRNSAVANASFFLPAILFTAKDKWDQKHQWEFVAPHMPCAKPDVGTRVLVQVLLLKCSFMLYILCREVATGSSNPFPFSPNCKYSIIYFQLF